jgi:transposase
MTFKGERSHIVSEFKMRRIPHMMLENKLVCILIEQRRFSFPKHNKRLWEELPGVQKRKQTTNSFRLHTLRELQRDNYAGSGKKRHMSGMFTMKILDDLEIDFKWTKGITKIGLDGKWVRKGSVLHHLADLDKGKSIFVIPNLKQFQLKKNF